MRRKTSKQQQKGLASVEFAIIGSVFFVVLFGVIEMGRALFVVNTLAEATRRGARMAAVCPVGSAGPASAAVFDNGTGSSAVVNGLTTNNIEVDYLDSNGNVLPNPTVTYGAIDYVRVKIVGFTLPLYIPFVLPTLALSGFAATLPRESLGVTRTAVQGC